MTLPLLDDDMLEVSAWKREARNPLRIEMDAAVLRLDLRQMDILRGIGLPAAQLHAEAAIGLVQVETDSRDFWTPIDTGKAMLVTPLVEEESVVDLIAFDPKAPDRWYLRTGAGWALGHDAVRRATDGWGEPERLELHPTPLEWLRSGCSGACVAQWTDEARMALRSLVGIDVGLPRFAHVLRLELSRPPRLPDIQARKLRQHAA